MSKSRKTCQIRIEGGEPFAVQLKANPVLHHDGGVTLWSGHITVEVRAQLLAAISEVAGDATISCTTVEETAEQKRLRGQRTQDGVPFFQTQECPLCFFYDLDTENHCGLDDWDPATLESALEQRAATDSRKKCPLSK